MRPHGDTGTRCICVLRHVREPFGHGEVDGCLDRLREPPVEDIHLRPASDRLALTAATVDVVLISVLVVLSGGAFSHARLALFLVPVSVAFRFRPAITSVAVIVTTSAYVIQAFAHPASSQPDAARFIATQAGFLAWVGVACVLLSAILRRRTSLVERLADDRSRLVADALAAEQRERQALAESLHDHAIQNVLSARHELEEAGETVSHPALTRAEGALSETVEQLREAVFELHPYVLDEAGLEAALRSIAKQAEARGRLAVTLDIHYPDRHPREQLLFSAARELLGNVVQHADASRATLRLVERPADTELTVEDDGNGVSSDELAAQLAQGHIGLTTQRVRVEAAGGTMEVDSEPGAGTRVTIRLPN